MPPEPIKDLRGRLISLARRIVEKTDELKAAGKVVLTQSVRFTKEVSDPRSERDAEVLVPDWYCASGPEWTFTGATHAEAADWIESLAEFTEAVQSARAVTNWACGGVKRFALEFLKVAPEHPSSQSIEDHATAFSDSLADKPVRWNAVATVTGLRCALPDADLGGGFVLRSKPPEYAILHCCLIARDWQEVRRQLHCLVDSLRLFRVGSLAVSKEMARTAAITCLCPFEIRDQHYHIWEDYNLTSGDLEPLRDFVTRVKPRLPPKPDLLTAFEWYREALVQPGSLDRRVTAATICLESLYLCQEQGELTRKVSQRSALFLGLRRFMPLQVLNNVKEAYSIRSGVVHGTRRSDSKPDPALCALAREVLEYARVSLLVMLQLGMGMKDLTTKLDQGLVDPAAKEDLKSSIGDESLLGEAPPRD